MSTPQFVIRFPRELVNSLKQAARVESLERQEDISWIRLLREAAERYLKEHHANRVTSADG